MIKNYLRILLCGGAIACSGLPALANFDITQGTGTHIFSLDSGTTPAGTGNCAASSTECTASIPIDKSGTPLFATGNAGLVTGTGGTFPVTQGTASNLNATVVGTGTFATQAAQSGTWSVTATQATGSNLHMVCDSGCSGSGGTSSSFGSGFPSVGTAIGLTDGTNMVAWSATTNYGTAPATIKVPAVNAFITNGISLGQTTAGNSAPSVLALGQVCNAHGFVHVTSATDTLLVQGVTGQTVRVCGYKASFAGTATAYLENTASTNANCSSSNTQITGLDSGVANNVFGFYGLYNGLANTISNGLCLKSTGTGGVDVDYWYWQG